MAYSTVLVHLELGHSNLGLLQVAREIAESFDAHVIGAAACQPFVMTLGDGYISGDFIEQNVDEITEEIKEAEARFRSALASGARSVEWRSTTLCSSIADVIARASSGADLIMTGAITHQAFDAQRHVSRGDLLMLAGRPLLVVPETPVTPKVGNVLVAWKDTREARRAVLDALPLLKRASYATLVELTTESKLSDARDQLGEIVRWLKRHDIHAHPSAIASRGDDVKQLDNIAREQDAEVVVAGAYGHSRLREWALGGFTRELITPTARCSFLSH